MPEYLKERESNCTNCYKCIRHCPVKCIRFYDSHAHVVPEECVLCGACMVECPRGVKLIRDDIPVVRQLLEGDDPVHAIVDPTFVANYPGVSMETMRGLLMKLGFSGAEEADIGIAAVAAACEKYIREKPENEEERRVLISSTCPSVNLLIRQYYPDLLSYLLPIRSPMEAHCLDIKKRVPRAKTVYIGPCLAQKAEACESGGLVDAVITFKELTRWFHSVMLRPEKGAEDSNPMRIYAASAGLERVMELSGSHYHHVTIEGIDQCRSALENIRNGGADRCFIEMYACLGHCLNGPAMLRKHKGQLEGFAAVRRMSAGGQRPSTVLAPEELHKEMPAKPISSYKPTRDEIERVLHEMGKLTPRDELNCESCGYATCRDKAVAVLQGKAELSMCMPFLKDKAEAFSSNIIKNTPNGILVLDQYYTIRLMNKAASRIFGGADASCMIGRQIDALLARRPFELAGEAREPVEYKDKYLEEYDIYVDMVIVFENQYKTYICIIRDVTERVKQDIRKEEVSRHTIEITDKIIEKQMRTVQEIASLLGETTAETKVALTRLKETMKL